jgi:hypothetical protein
MNPVSRLLWAMEQSPSIGVPIGNEAGILLTNQLMDPVLKVVLGLLLLASLHLRGPCILVRSESANGFHLNNSHALIYNTEAFH